MVKYARINTRLFTKNGFLVQGDVPSQEEMKVAGYSMDKLPQTYALLIGIDQYLPNTLPGNKQKYKSLHGCVRDAVHMEEFLRRRLALPDAHIIRLLAPDTAPITPAELAVPHHQFPTYSAIVSAFQRQTRAVCHRTTSRPLPFDETTGNPTLRPGEWTFVCIKNASRWTLNITVFDLAPDWSITKVFPDDEASHALDPGEEYIFELQADLPNGLNKATDTLKVFATLKSTDFQWLELPVLDKLVHKRSTHGQISGNPLEELLFALMQEAPATRNLRPGVHPSWEWTTAQLEIDVCSDY